MVYKFYKQRNKMMFFAQSFRRIKSNAILLIERIHVRAFGHEMSDEMRRFLGNFSVFFSAGLLSAVIMFVINIAAGRFLGPIEFGRYNYILSWATTLVLFFLLGNNQSSVRYLSDKTYEERRSNIVGSVIFLTVAQVSTVLIVAVFLKGIIPTWLQLGISTVHAVFFFGLVLALKELLDSFMRSFGYFRLQGLIKVVDALVVLLGFLLFWKTDLFGSLSAFHYVYAMTFGASFSIVCFLLIVQRRIGMPTWRDTITILQYNKFLVLGMVASVIMSLEKVFIGNYIGLEALGVYSAYYASSQMILSNISLLFMNVFWPMVVRNKENMESVIHKLTTVFFKYFPIWFVLNCTAISLLLLLFGRQYPLYSSYVVLFSVVSLLNIFFSVYMGIMNIDKIARSVMVNTLLFGTLIASIVVFKSIFAYLVFQLFVYSAGIVYVRNNLLADLQKKKL